MLEYTNCSIPFINLNRPYLFENADGDTAAIKFEESSDYTCHYLFHATYKYDGVVYKEGGLVLKTQAADTLKKIAEMVASPARFWYYTAEFKEEKLNER